ncbi:MAG: hypothetical protein AAF787_11445 [Chloroflexota bacterium]
MKVISKALLAFLLLFSLAACGGLEETESDEDSVEESVGEDGESGEDTGLEVEDDDDEEGEDED